jgi:hypothetical protein
MEDRPSMTAVALFDRPIVDHQLSLSEELARRPVAAAAQRRIELAHHRELQLVHCANRDGELVLTGQVPSYFHKQVAQECVRVVPGVRRIRNLLRVLPQSY